MAPVGPAAHLYRPALRRVLQGVVQEIGDDLPQAEFAASLAAGMGQYVGQVINETLFRRIRATQLSFLQNMLGQGLLGSRDGSLPFSVICDASNNPLSRTGLGYVQSDAQVQYQAINEKFIVNMEGGQTVQVSRQVLPGASGGLAA